MNARATSLALAAAFALTSCEGEPTQPRTAQREGAIQRTQERLERAGRQTQEKLAEVGERTQEKLEKAGRSAARLKGVDVKLGERTSVEAVPATPPPQPADGGAGKLWATPGGR